MSVRTARIWTLMLDVNFALENRIFFFTSDEIHVVISHLMIQLLNSLMRR